MREIKFRTWDKRFKNMIYSGAMAILYLNDKDHEIMQFTGLLDRNKKEIWEGDIVTFHLGRDYKGTIEWSDDESGFQIMPYFRWLTPRLEIEVIGNIYQNPELLEDK